MAGKRKAKPAPLPQHRVALDDDDSVVSASRKSARPPKHYQTEDKLISAKLSTKILTEALHQQKEILREQEEENPNPFSSVSVDPSVSGDDEDADEFVGFSETQSYYDVKVEIDEEDEKVLAAFSTLTNSGPQPTLADIIIKRIKEKEAEVASGGSLPELDNSIVEIYKGVGECLSKYTSGKIPHALKFIPAVQQWEYVLCLTEPENWTENALYQATRIFSSNLSMRKAQRFYNLVLLPRVRENIRKNKKLHFALYQALKKSLYKPSAFFKGFLIPLCESGTCSLREAVIIGSIIQKVSIPILQSGAALMKMAELEYCGTTSYFIKLIIDKKYALPHRVFDAVCAHFMRFLEDKRIMPVIWHQSLLSFVQRYKDELSKGQADDLYRLIQYQKHHLVTPEIRRELKNSQNGGVKKDKFSSICVTPIQEDRWDVPEVPMEED